MKLENWAIVMRETNPFKDPGQIKLQLTGNVYDHPRFDDGTNVITSSIETINEDDKIITYSGSEYELGKVCEDYEKQFPNAYERLIKVLKDGKEKTKSLEKS